MTENFWDQSTETIAGEFTGGGVIGKCRVDLGYKVYVKGLGGDEQEKTFLPYTNAKTRKATLAKGRTFAKAQGVTARAVQHAVQIRMFRDSCFGGDGQPVTWQYDRFNVVDLWPRLRNPEDPSAANAVMDSIIEHKVQAGQDEFLRIIWIDDPHFKSLGEKTDEDQEGNPRYKTVAVIAERYVDAAAAQAAIAAGGEAAESYPWDDFPGEWGEDDWSKIASAYDMYMAEPEEDYTLTGYVEDNFDMDVTWFVRVLSLGGLDNGEIAELTGLSKGKIKKALK